MKKMWLWMATMLLMISTLAAPVKAQSASGGRGIGVWTMFITVQGASPCQCIQVARFNADGTLDGPANDHFSGTAMGEWRFTSESTINFALAQNTINTDGTAGGVYVITGTMKLDPSGDQASGTTSFQVLAVDRSVLFSGTATLTGTRVKPR